MAYKFTKKSNNKKVKTIEEMTQEPSKKITRAEWLKQRAMLIEAMEMAKAVQEEFDRENPNEVGD